MCQKSLAVGASSHISSGRAPKRSFGRRGGLSTFLARHVRFALRRRVFDTLRIAERNTGAAMEGQFAIDSAAAGADTDEICGLG